MPRSPLSMASRAPRGLSVTEALRPPRCRVSRPSSEAIAAAHSFGNSTSQAFRVPSPGLLPIAHAAPAGHAGNHTHFLRQSLSRNPTAQDKNTARPRAVCPTWCDTFKLRFRSRVERFDQTPQIVSSTVIGFYRQPKTCVDCSWVARQQ